MKAMLKAKLKAMAQNVDTTRHGCLFGCRNPAVGCNPWRTLVSGNANNDLFKKKEASMTVRGQYPGNPRFGEPGFSNTPLLVHTQVRRTHLDTAELGKS